MDGYELFKVSALSHLKKLVIDNVIVIKANNQKKIRKTKKGRQFHNKNAWS